MNTLQNFLTEFHNGTCTRAFAFLGCHKVRRSGTAGFVFRVWAPNAAGVSVVGDFNFWNPEDLPMRRISDGGVWEAFSAFAREGCSYKYYVRHADGSGTYKADPYAFRTTPLPDTSSVICRLDGHAWGDGAWRKAAANRNPLKNPVNIYEMHLGSWRQKEDGCLYSYDELAGPLIEYLQDMHYTHVEFMPLTEYPYTPSWGYQVTGYYAPTARYGSPEGLMNLVDRLHQAGIGVILDWVPAHFPKDEYGLFEFDGTCCYELSDPLMNEHPDWTTRIFDYGRPEVRSFLVSNALFWLEQYHMDGLRVDAVASMLYLDYNRKEFHPNRFGGRENLEAIDFLRAVNRAAFSVRRYPLMIAEESTTFPLITRPDYDGGLGFLFKWNMGWMNDTLEYGREDPLFRKYKHEKLTFSMTYAFSENFILPLSHDEVVHGKHSLLDKMPGNYDEKFSGLRTLLAYQMAHPGKKLLFMGGEFGQFIEWRYDRPLDWFLLDYDRHRQMQAFTQTLNRIYLEQRPLWQNDQDWAGFQWIQPDDRDNSIIAFRRIDHRGREIIAIFNFCPVLREDYRLGLPSRGVYVPLLNSDDTAFGGSGVSVGLVCAEPVPFRDYAFSGRFRLPPLSALYFRRQAGRVPECVGK